MLFELIPQFFVILLLGFAAALLMFILWRRFRYFPGSEATLLIDIETLNNFYKEVSTSEGMNIVVFRKRLASLFAGRRTDNDIENYRLGKNPWKKLRDEITPVSRFLKFNAIEADRIRFPLDNHTPDCWIMTRNGEEKGIEVTIERGREKYHLATELNEAGMGRGFIGIQDDSPQTDFDNRMSNPRAMFAPNQALDATKAGILRCLSRKNDQKFSNVFYLLIQAHLIVLPKERWKIIYEELTQAAKNLPFQEVYIIGDTNEKPWGFRIK